MNTYILSFPFHPDRFNPDSVEQRIALIAAFKAARPAYPLRMDFEGKEPRLLSDDIKDAEIYAVEALL